MTNGTYRIKHKQLGTEYKLVAYSGILKLYSVKGHYVKTYKDDKTLLEFCDVIEQIPGAQNNYDLAYFVQGKLKERIVLGASYAVAIHKKNELRKSTHKIGMLIPVRQDK